MIGLIPAAGLGSRMGALTRRTHKGLLEVGGASILDRAIASFRGVGIRDIVLVTGHASDRLEARFGGHVRFVRNPDYRTMGILSSFHAARPLIGESPFLFTTADHCFARSLLSRLVDSPGDVVSLVQEKAVYDAEDGKVAVGTDGKLHFCKEIFPRHAVGEYGGMTRFSGPGARAFWSELTARYPDLGRQGYVMNLLNLLVRNSTVDSRILTCGETERIEIDTVADLRRARELAEEMFREELSRDG